MSALVELAERCEKATGPDRRLDVEIIKAVGWSDEQPYRDADSWREPLDFTASLDAAMMLVPEGCGVLLQWPGSYVGKPWAHINLPYDGPIPAPIKSEAATPALTLCAAALRARAEQ